MSLAVSTGWNSKRQPEARAIIDEILSLGIERIEAGYALTYRQLEGLVESLPRVRVVSVHNYCPIPTSHKCAWGDDYLLSSLDEEKRAAGVQTTCETIEWAERLGARVVVMHLGQVEMDKTLCRLIRQWMGEDNPDAATIAAKVQDAREARAQRAPQHMEAVKRSIDDILNQTRGSVVLGFENRSDYNEIPNLEEMEQLLSAYGRAVGYWHDIGHAYMQEFMGFYPPNEHIRSFSNRLVGAHIHDSLRLSDHRAPGYGEIDFESCLQPYLRDDVLQVLELHPRTTFQEAQSGIEFLRRRRIVQ